MVFLIYLKFRFYKESKSTEYVRQVFTMLGEFGNIGGVKEYLKIIGGLILKILSRRMLLFLILSSLYQVDSSSNSKINDSLMTIIL